MTHKKNTVFFLFLAIFLSSINIERAHAIKYSPNEESRAALYLDQNPEVSAEEESIEKPVLTATETDEQNTLYGVPYATNVFNISTEKEWEDVLKKVGIASDAENVITINLLGNLNITRSTLLHGSYENITINGGNQTISLANVSSKGLISIANNPNIQFELNNIAFDGQNDIYNDSSPKFNNKFMYVTNSNLTLIANSNTIIKNFRSIDYPYYYGGAIYLEKSVFTLKGGKFDSNLADYGGGAIYAENSTVTIDEGTFFNKNKSTRPGGAISVTNSTLTMSNLNFSGNTSGYSGGAVQATYSALRANNLTFENNQAGIIGSHKGGAIYLGSAMTTNPDGFWADSKIVDSRFIQNNATESAGAIYLFNNSLDISSSIFEKNKAGIAGGAMATQNGKIKATDCEFIENAAKKNAGGAISTGNRGYIDVANSVFRSNTAGIEDLPGSTYQKVGGAIRAHGAEYITLTSVTFDSNMAQGAGGALTIIESYIERTPTTLLGTNIFKNNTSVTEFGGAIQSDSAPLFIEGDAQFISNTAKTYGGAIGFRFGIPIYKSDFTVGPDVVFTGNKADPTLAVFYLIKDHLTYYNENIKTTIFSHFDDGRQFVQGFNNYDIGEYDVVTLEFVNEDSRIDIDLSYLQPTESFGWNYKYPLQAPTLSPEQAEMFTFAGWDVNGVLYEAGAEYTFTLDNVIAKATWKANHTLTLHGNFGIFEENNSETLVKKYDDSDLTVNLALFTPDRLGYTLIGWDINKNATVPQYPINGTFSLPVGNTQLFAIWQQDIAQEFMVIYNANGGTGELPANKTYAANSEVIIESATLEKETYDFIGWTIDGKIYAPGSTFIIQKDTEILAAWKANHTLTLHGNLGIFKENNTETLVKKYDDSDLTVNLALFTPDRLGYTLIGWDNNKNSTVPQYPINGTFNLPVGNTQLFAIWQQDMTQEFRVIYNANGGTGELPANKTYAANSEVTIESATLKKEKYDFIGWTIDGKIYAPGSTFIIQKDTEILATWKLKPEKPEPEKPEPEKPEPEKPEPERPEPEKPEPEKPEPEKPKPEKPKPEKPEPEKPKPEKPKPEKPELEKPELEKPELEKPELEKSKEELLADLREEAKLLGIHIPENLTYEEAVDFFTLEKERISLGGIVVTTEESGKIVNGSKTNPQTGETINNSALLFTSVIIFIIILFLLHIRRRSINK